MNAKLNFKRSLSVLLAVMVLPVLAWGAASSSKSANRKTTPYPLKTCIVTENDLESMGGAITRVYEGQEIKFCCKPCIKKFEANPPRYLARIAQPSKS